jgi:hypothetical protein|uniref:Transcriptional regulator, RHH-like, CopG n=1 Tax=Myoviridae sp. ctsip2 TaxID=2826705 RepID=A0A8S5N560_9CAUD|nr:MAG TPA: Transcriptional regulator, RHH-like, CopG [Myoviridae sp. ctsip2]
MIKDTNKRMVVVISKEDYERLEQIAKKECRSVSKQSLLYILEGIKNSEGKRD